MLYKLSIACQAHRIFKTDPTRTIINFLIVWLVICGAMTVCGALFYCSPVEKCWNVNLPGRCGNRSAMVYTWAGFNLLNDIIILGKQNFLPSPFLSAFKMGLRMRRTHEKTVRLLTYLLVLPIPYLVKLQLDHKSRLVLLSLFACGFLYVSYGIFRVHSPSLTTDQYYPYFRHQNQGAVRQYEPSNNRTAP